VRPSGAGLHSSSWMAVMRCPSWRVGEEGSIDPAVIMTTHLYGVNTGDIYADTKVITIVDTDGSASQSEGVPKLVLGAKSPAHALSWAFARLS
jgi:hypothetical protein